jgi:hypothetical protein
MIANNIALNTDEKLKNVNVLKRLNKSTFNRKSNRSPLVTFLKQKQTTIIYVNGTNITFPGKQ